MRANIRHGVQSEASISLVQLLHPNTSLVNKLQRDKCHPAAKLLPPTHLRGEDKAFRANFISKRTMVDQNVNVVQSHQETTHKQKVYTYNIMFCFSTRAKLSQTLTAAITQSTTTKRCQSQTYPSPMAPLPTKSNYQQGPYYPYTNADPLLPAGRKTERLFSVRNVQHHIHEERSFSLVFLPHFSVVSIDPHCTNLPFKQSNTAIISSSPEVSNRSPCGEKSMLFTDAEFSEKVRDTRNVLRIGSSMNNSLGATTSDGVGCGTC